MTTDPMLARIRALLAKAEDPAATPAEAETYTGKANELIAKYGIDAALLAAAQDDGKAPTPGSKIFDVEAPYAPDKVSLLNTIALALRCRAIRLSTGWRNKYQVHVFGFTADLERVELLYTSLLIQQAQALAVAHVPWGVNTAAFRRSWMEGYRLAVHGRLLAAEKRAAQQAQTSTGPSVALVLANRDTMVDQLVRNTYPKLGKGRGRQLSSTAGRSSGYESGRKANLGGTGIHDRGAGRAVGA